MDIRAWAFRLGWAVWLLGFAAVLVGGIACALDVWPWVQGCFGCL